MLSKSLLCILSEPGHKKKEQFQTLALCTLGSGADAGVNWAKLLRIRERRPLPRQFDEPSTTPVRKALMITVARMCFSSPSPRPK